MSVIIVACSVCLLNAFAIFVGDCFLFESYCVVVVKCVALCNVCLCY